MVVNYIFCWIKFLRWVIKAILYKELYLKTKQLELSRLQPSSALYGTFWQKHFWAFSHSHLLSVMNIRLLCFLCAPTCFQSKLMTMSFKCLVGTKFTFMFLPEDEENAGSTGITSFWERNNMTIWRYFKKCVSGYASIQWMGANVVCMPTFL